MKKISFLMFAVFAFLLKANAQEPKFVSTEKQNRNVLIEDFTGVGCLNCPEGHLIANNIVNDNPGRVWTVNIHSGYYATNNPNLKTEDGDIIHNSIHSGAYPNAVINRSTPQTLTKDKWLEKSSEQMLQSAECNLAGQVVINSNTRVATIEVEVYYTEDSDNDKNYLTVMMLQDNIVAYQSGSEKNPSQVVSGGYNHMHILRDVITPTWGEEIAPTTSSTLVRRTYSYKIPQIIGDPNGVAVDLDNINFIAFVTEKQEDALTRPILNVNELAIVEGDASAESIGEETVSFNIYPNPVDDKLYIETEVEIEEVVVYDVYGRQQELSAVSCQPSAIDVSNLNSGVYFVKVVTKEGETVKRFIKD